MLSSPRSEIYTCPVNSKAFHSSSSRCSFSGTCSDWKISRMRSSLLFSSFSGRKHRSSWELSSSTCLSLGLDCWSLCSSLANCCLFACLSLSCSSHWFWIWSTALIVVNFFQMVIGLRTFYHLLFLHRSFSSNSQVNFWCQVKQIHLLYRCFHCRLV